ncbi:hypothetical protein N7526_011496 [Penicillium atrosanguineum]|nr:hypothetical protein N7526_011496 [Penicillium atrosanguineum]
MHIPTNLSQAIPTKLEVNAHKEPIINDDYGLAPQERTVVRMGAQPAHASMVGKMWHLWRRWLRRTVVGLFSAHHHGDTWCYKWEYTVKGNGLNL